MSGRAPQDLKVAADQQSEGRSMAPSPGHDYTDNRAPWDWPSKYPPAARKCINTEAAILAVVLVLLLVGARILSLSCWRLLEYRSADFGGHERYYHER